MNHAQAFHCSFFHSLIDHTTNKNIETKLEIPNNKSLSNCLKSKSPKEKQKKKKTSKRENVEKKYKHDFVKEAVIDLQGQ